MSDVPLPASDLSLPAAAPDPLNPPPEPPTDAKEPPDEPELLPMTNCRLFRRSQVAHLDRPVPWVWHGYLSRCQLTLLTGQWKIGKTTLLAALLARMGAGGELAGRRVSPGRAVVITEEGVNLWLMRMARHGIGDAVSFAFSPFVRKPLPRQWGYLLDDLAAVNRKKRVDLVVIDPLAAVLPGREESSAAAMTDALRPVRELASNGPAVLLLHHPRKGSTPGGQGSRGTGALPAFVDFQVEMHWAGPATAENRRRRLAAWSRHEETPRRLLVELSADGLDWAAVADESDEADEPADELGRTLEGLLRAHPDLTAREALDRWPPGTARPRPKAVFDRLRALADAGRLERTGRGDRYSPFRYRVAETQSVSCANPVCIDGS
jgi:AAA domain